MRGAVRRGARLAVLAAGLTALSGCGVPFVPFI